MKFTKEQAIQDLIAKFKVKDKDLNLDRTITQNVENVLRIVGETYEGELNDFTALVEPNVDVALGLLRHEVSSTAKSLQDKIKELEAQLNKKDPEPKQPKNEDEKTYNDLLEKLTALEAKIQTAETEKTLTDKKNALVAKIGESVKDKEWIDTILAKTSITAELDVEKEAKDYVEMYNKTHARRGGGFTPKSPDGNGDDKPDLSGLDDALRNFRGEFGTPKQE